MRTLYNYVIYDDHYSGKENLSKAWEIVENNVQIESHAVTLFQNGSLWEVSLFQTIWQLLLLFSKINDYFFKKRKVYKSRKMGICAEENNDAYYLPTDISFFQLLR